jgi:hypothetical protein
LALAVLPFHIHPVTASFLLFVVTSALNFHHLHVLCWLQNKSRPRGWRGNTRARGKLQLWKDVWQLEGCLNDKCSFVKRASVFCCKKAAREKARMRTHGTKAAECVTLVMLPVQPRRVERKNTRTFASRLLEGSIDVMVASDKGNGRKRTECN